MKLPIAVLLIASAVAVPTFAEKADRNKPVEFEYDKLVGTDLQLQTTGVFEGNVVITQGSLRIQAARMVVKRDDKDNVFAEMFGSPTQPISFRVKREGKEEFIDGRSDRGEFDQKASTVKLFANARIESGGNVVTGDYVFYNTETEQFEVTGTGTAGKTTVGGDVRRGRLVIQPRSTETKPVESKSAEKK